MSYRDDYDALDAQLQAARKEAAAQRQSMGEELESERRKVRDLERKLRELKRARKEKPSAQEQAKKRTRLVTAALIFMVVVGAAAGYLFMAVTPVEEAKPVKPRQVKPHPPRKPSPHPVKLAKPAPGTLAHLISLTKSARSAHGKALTDIAAAAVLHASAQTGTARELLGAAREQLKEKMHDLSRLRITGLTECLTEVIDGTTPGAAGRYPKLQGLLDKQLSYKIAADTWTWVGRVCADLRGAAAAREALPRALDTAGKVKSYQRLKTILAVASVYEDWGDREGVDRVGALFLKGGAELIAADQVKARALLAEIYWRLGAKDRAATLLADASDRGRGKYYSTEGRALVARALALAGQRDKAELWLKEATEAVKADSTWTRNRSLPYLGTAHILLGRAEQGRAMMEGKTGAAEALLAMGNLKAAARENRLTNDLRHRLAMLLARAGEAKLAIEMAGKRTFADVRALALAGAMLNTNAEAKPAAPEKETP